MNKAHSFHKFLIFLICVIALTGCMKNKNVSTDNLKSVQVFKKNSGSNYMFVSNKLQDEK